MKLYGTIHKAKSKLDLEAKVHLATLNAGHDHQWRYVESLGNTKWFKCQRCGSILEVRDTTNAARGKQGQRKAAPGGGGGAGSYKDYHAKPATVREVTGGCDL